MVVQLFYEVTFFNLADCIFNFQEKDRATRFNFLLAKTEIFSHFMNPTSGKKPKSPLKIKAPDFPSPGKKTSDIGEYVHGSV